MAPPPVPAADAAPAFKNKEKVLVLSTRGVTFRYRHLMEDVIGLLPHSKKESKLDTKSDRGIINEVSRAHTHTLDFGVGMRPPQLAASSHAWHHPCTDSGCRATHLRSMLPSNPHRLCCAFFGSYCRKTPLL